MEYGKAFTFTFCEEMIKEQNRNGLYSISQHCVELVVCLCAFSPKCRHEYSQKDCPKQYRCYCGKVVDPVFDPWLVPHSCGQECGCLLYTSDAADE